MELSNLVIYCKSVMFNSEKMLSGHFTEMSSFPETKAEKLMSGPGGDAVKKLLTNQKLAMVRLAKWGPNLVLFLQKLLHKVLGLFYQNLWV